jgi:hypothetical protein
LINRLTVKDGMLTTPEGIRYRVLWLPNNERMLPATLEKIYSLVRDGAIIVGKAPQGLATLSGGPAAQSQFDDLVKKIWGNSSENIRKIGRGYVIPSMTLGDALAALKVRPDVIGGALWLHRRTAGADWYFISAPKGKGFTGELSFRTAGNAELWDPVTGTSAPLASRRTGDRTMVKLDLAQSNACFVVFRHIKAVAAHPPHEKLVSSLPLSGPWTITFPAGWGISSVQEIKDLEPWKDLALSPEGKAFSGTAVYQTTFTVDGKPGRKKYVLDLGDVDMVAAVVVNGKKVGNLLAPPYRIDLKDVVRMGQNTLEVKVTSTWFNRLVFDAGQAEEKRKTWVINGPDANSPLRVSGLLGPVTIQAVEIQ